MESRVLVHAPRGRDAAIVCGVIEPNQSVRVCGTAEDFLARLDESAAAAIVTEEALLDASLVRALPPGLTLQPAWSDFPFIVLAPKRAGRRPPQAVDTLHSL